MTDLPIEQHMQIVWDAMSDNHRQFVIARLLTRSDAEACRQTGLSQQTVTNWPNKKLIDEYIAYQRRETLTAARFALVESSLDAVAVLRKKLKGQQGLTAAKEILDRAGLAAITRQEISGPDKGPIEFVDAKSSLERKLLTAIAASATPSVSGQPDAAGSGDVEI